MGVHSLVCALSFAHFGKHGCNRKSACQKDAARLRSEQFKLPLISRLLLRQQCRCCAHHLKPWILPFLFYSS